MSEKCQVCNFIKNELKCTLCEAGYYVSSKGECISYLNYIKPILKCKKYFYNINNITFKLYSYYYSYNNEVYNNYSRYFI